MTVIEFFDSSATENITGSFLYAPEKTVYVGDNRHLMDKSLAVYREVLSLRGIETVLSYKAVNKNNLKSILSILNEIIEKNDDCVFDLTGGDDLYLVAVGMMLERYPDKIRAYRFNLNACSAVDAFSGEAVLNLPTFSLSADENIRLHGGKIVSQTPLPTQAENGKINTDFFTDIEKLWKILAPSARFYNAQTNILGKLDATFGAPNALSIAFAKKDAEEILDKTPLSTDFLEALKTEGLLSISESEESLSLGFKNETIKCCLTKAGQVLEFKIAGHLLSLEEDGKQLYKDVRVGILIDWDTQAADLFRTQNEIDIIAIKDAIPIFISCKNGAIEAEELYKLNSVAERFGGKYVKKVLIATELEKLGAKTEHLRARAADMGIRLLENVDEWDDQKLDRALRSLWLN